MSKTFKSAAAALMLVGALGASSQAQALSILIDGFGDDAATGTTVHDASGTGPGSNGASTDGPAGAGLLDTDLSSANRVITAESFGAFATEDVIANNSGASGYLEINNSSTSNGIASLYYTFASQDFTALGGTALLLDVQAIDLGVQVNMIVNGTSSSGFQAFTGPGQFFALFSSFSDPSQFISVTSLELDFKGVTAWDSRFDNLRVDIPPPPNAPEPATLALIGMGLAGFAAARKKKQA